MPGHKFSGKDAKFKPRCNPSFPPTQLTKIKHINVSVPWSFVPIFYKIGITHFSFFRIKKRFYFWFSQSWFKVCVRSYSELNPKWFHTFLGCDLIIEVAKVKDSVKKPLETSLDYMTSENRSCFLSLTCALNKSALHQKEHNSLMFCERMECLFTWRNGLIKVTCILFWLIQNLL